METIDSGERARIFSLALKLKVLVVPISCVIVLIIFYSFILSPKLKEIKRLKADVTQKERQLNSMRQSVGLAELSLDEKKNWSEVEMRISAKLFPYETLNTLKELVYIARKSQVDKIQDISVPTDQLPKMTAPLEYYLVKILFHTERYDVVSAFLGRMNELSSLGDVESVKLNGETSGILVDLTLRVYRMSEIHAQK